MSVFAFRISASYADIGSTLLKLIDLTEKVAIYEHPADEKVANTHIHGLLMTCSRKEDTLREKFFKKHWKGKYQLATTYKDQDDNVQPVNEGYVSYMSKGKFEPSFVKGFTTDKISELKAKWVNHTRTDPAVDSASPDKKKKESVCIFDIILKVSKMCDQQSIVNNNGTLSVAVEPSIRTWYVLCEELNKARIRTSRNELERAWVTLLRLDQRNQDTLYSSIMKNVFRDH